MVLSINLWVLFLNHFKGSVGYLHNKKNKNHYHLRLNETSLVVYFLDY